MTHTFPDGTLQELKFGEDPNQKLVIYYYKGIVQIAFNTPPPFSTEKIPDSGVEFLHIATKFAPLDKL